MGVSHWQMGAKGCLNPFSTKNPFSCVLEIGKAAILQKTAIFSGFRTRVRVISKWLQVSRTTFGRVATLSMACDALIRDPKRCFRCSHDQLIQLAHVLSRKYSKLIHSGIQDS
jgi:hypothetical protein